MNPKDPIIYRDPVIFTITERKTGEVAINTQHPAGQEHLKGRQNVWRKCGRTYRRRTMDNKNRR